MTKESAEAARCDFVNRCKADPNLELYVIGLADNGITLYKQQVRALNLIYTLKVTGRLKGSLAVLGGGAAGATAALAAASLGHEVTIFEQRPTLFHLQQGCDIRWLHPHIYEWPAPSTDSPYAGLPLLDWEFATAAGVAARLHRGWDDEKKKNPDLKLTEHYRASAHVAGGSNKGITVRWDNSGADPRSGEKLFDTVVVAVGFGVERGVLSGNAQSYWRNDSVNQPLPGIPSQRAATYFISGTGDGGLIDLLRVCITDFNQGRILEELFSPTDALIGKLRLILTEWNGLSGDEREKPDKKDWLFKKYEALGNAGDLENLDDSLKGPRLRDDTVVNLNGRELTFSQSLSLGGASLFNTLLVYVLYCKRAFSYVPGECVREGESTARVKCGKFEYDYPVDRLIFRHGPLRWETLEAAGVSAEQIKGLMGRQGDIRSYTPERLWTAGWWKDNQVPKPVKEDSRIEFVSPVTRAIATTFVTTLGEMLIRHEEEKRKKPVKFRVTLHRIVKFQEDVVFQQVSRYAGTEQEGAVGRVIAINTGLVGLVCRFGEPLIVTREKDFDQLWKDAKLEEGGARGVRPPVMSLLACPFFAPKLEAEEPPSIVAVLFMDSEEKDFFSDPAVLKLIYSGCKGFVRDLDEKKERNEVGFVTTDWRGHQVTATPGELKDLDEKYESLADDGGVFKGFEKDLTFTRVPSLEMHLRGIRTS